MAEMKTVRLTHSSNQPGAEGEPGDVITCSAHIADMWIEARGAVEVVSEDTPHTPPVSMLTAAADQQPVQEIAPPQTLEKPKRVKAHHRQGRRRRVTEPTK